MTRSGWQQTWVRILTTVLSLLMMVLIFCFSAQDADRSDSTSEGLTQIVVSVIAPDYDSLPPERRLSVHNSVEFAIRKLADHQQFDSCQRRRFDRTDNTAFHPADIHSSASFSGTGQSVPGSCMNPPRRRSSVPR